MIRCRFKKDISEKDKNIKKGLEWLSMAESPIMITNSHSDENRYIILGWDEKDDEKIMMAHYYFEKLFGELDLERFKETWKNQEYYPDTVISFPAECFVEVEE